MFHRFKETLAEALREHTQHSFYCAEMLLFFQVKLFKKNEAFCSVFLRPTYLHWLTSVTFYFLCFFLFFTVFFTLISFFPLLDLIPSYFLSPPSFSFSCLTQEAVISKRSVLADIFHGTSLISTPRVAIGQQKLPPFPTNPP